MRNIIFIVVAICAMACQDKHLAQRELLDNSAILNQIHADSDYLRYVALHRKHVFMLASGLVDVNAHIKHWGAMPFTVTKLLEEYCDVSTSELDDSTKEYVRINCEMERIKTALITRNPVIETLSPEEQSMLWVPDIREFEAVEIESILSNQGINMEK
jgi:hypothetical protein